MAAVNGGGIYTWKRTPRPQLTVAPSNGSLLLSWIVPSVPFVLRQSADLASTNWINTPVLPTLNPSNLRNEVTIPMSGGILFYRLKSM